jgi:energy-coupling factor transporter ATP-binding protein EcfA2
MTLKSIFKKPIDRPIEGVIKADDEASLRLELEEYVLTNEVEKRLESFLDAYNNYENANGVWISGFFGSGKSHLLKILALLLENREIDGTLALDLFLTKCSDNEILRADLKRAVVIPSKSILFNIDQKADVISKAQVDALLAVFVKVFDEMCGYYGKQGHIAHFERDLDSRGIYDQFQAAFQALSGREWHKGREQALLESQNIAKAYAQVTNSTESSALGILDKYRSQYKVSIEDFAEQVMAYIDRQSSTFRLNFFVDEVGQYIAENVKLMTNLQTIAESLATKCRGRAWVIVTSQNDMSSVLGEMNNKQSNDFSKIMARFANKMLLTGNNVAEVIQKRLLAKTDDGAEMVSDLYHREANNFGTLFSFTDGSREYKVFRDRDEFIRNYPFVPYQFDLFQSAIENLSRHNAFEGKHYSVGERSMLGVFQQVAIQISDYELGQLATFDLMFEGIQTALKAQTQKAVLAADRQLNDSFAKKLLKALFLVKYVKEFKPTVRNLCVLMLESFGQDLPGLKKKIEEALNLLEQQTFIQRNGDLYEYLTDEEKDVEQEIKNTEVESTEVASELEKIIFDHVIKNKKIRYDETGQDYPFSRKIDDRLHGREYELTIQVVTPFHEFVDNQASLLMHSFGRDEMLVVMPPDDRLVRDILMYKRTEKYIRQNISTAQQEGIKRILTDKGFQNRERYAELQLLVQRLLGKARLFVAGTEIEISGEDPQSRINRGFSELVMRAYPNLRMLRNVTYREEQIKTILSDRQGTLEGMDVTSLLESEQEMLAFIQSNNRGGVRTTLKTLLEKMECKPYGWYYAAILCILAKLCARGKVEVRTDSNPLEDDDLDRALRNTHGHANVVLEPQVDFTASQVRSLKEFYQDFFDSPPFSNEAKALGKETGAALQELLHQLTPLAAQVTQYPFLTALHPVMDRLKDIIGKPYTWYLTELLRQEDELLDLKEKVIDPIRKFMGGPLKDIFNEARNFIQGQESNFSYLAGDESAHVISALTDPECFMGNRMQQVKTNVSTLQGRVEVHVAEEITKANKVLAGLQKSLCTMPEFTVLSPSQQSQITKPFADIEEQVRKQTLIAVIRDTPRRFEETEYPQLLSRVTAWSQVDVKPPVTGAVDYKSSPTPVAVTTMTEPPIKYVSSRLVQVSFDKPWLADESDVERYLDSMREALLTEIRSGKRIQI